MDKQMHDKRLHAHLRIMHLLRIPLPNPIRRLVLHSIRRRRPVGLHLVLGLC